jgi:spermidine synthase
LTLGSVAANLLCRLKTHPLSILYALLMLSGLFVGLSSIVFYRMTNGLENIYSSEGWAAYTLSIFFHTAVIILIPGIFIGSIYPYLLKMSQWVFRGPGRTMGQLAAMNTAGAIIGALTAGFFLLNFIGLWTSIKLMAMLYFIVTIFTVDRWSQERLVSRAVPAIGLILLILFLYSSDLALVKLDPKNRERVVEVWEGSHGIVSVVKKSDDLKIKVDNYYTLGGVSAVHSERKQAQMPLFVHPDAKSVFFLGMGTGITAEASLDFPIRSVISCELIPEVVTAARKHFWKYNSRLFDDPRSSIVIEDGRNFLMGNRQKYDVIVSDLFIPWQAGTGTLYSKEHFATSRSRLTEGGLFAQWMPLFQMSKEEFMIIAKTMLEVFPQVNFWRGDFAPDRSVGVLIGQCEKTPLNTASTARNVGQVIKRHAAGRVSDADVVPYMLYAGNLTEVKQLFEDYPVNTDDMPVIEFLSPRAQQEQETGRLPAFSSIQLIQFFDQLFSLVPPETDPYLKDLSDEQLGYVYGGLELHKAGTYKEMGEIEKARIIYRKLLSKIPLDIYPELKE